jgi:hypothetical protein
MAGIIENAFNEAISAVNAVGNRRAAATLASLIALKALLLILINDI